MIGESAEVASTEWREAKEEKAQKLKASFGTNTNHVGTDTRLE